MKTRIISETKCGKTIYKVQYKFLLWWFNETACDISIDGMCSKIDVSFHSYEKAKEYCCKIYSKPVIKVL